MKSTKSWCEQLLRDIERADLLRQPRRIRLTQDQVALEGRIEVAGRSATIAIVVASMLRYRLPMVFLRPWDALGFIPHVMPNGLICYLEHEGIVQDLRRPLDIVRDALVRVQRILQDGVMGVNLQDFVDEFDGYWSRLPGCLLAASGLDIINEAAEITIAASRHATIPIRIAQGTEDVTRVPVAGTGRGPWHAARAIYVPLEPGTLLVPPQPDQPFWDVGEVRSLLKYCSNANRERVQSLLSRRVSSCEHVIFALPRPAGGISLFGIRFEGVKELHPLVEGGNAEKLIPMIVARRDRWFMVERGGGHTQLKHKRVLLIGGGAIGGYLAFDLARAGVELLTIVDPDKLTEENTYRHVLGRRYWGRSKAYALRDEINTQLPFAHVRAVPEWIEDALTSGQVHLTEHDLIISAIGDPTTELALNARIRQIQDGPPVIFTWLEPLGIGGHVLLTGNGGDPGCFECLYTQANGTDQTLHNRASFIAPNQIFRRALGGCDTLHTPYGAMDAGRTANLAARVVINTLTGNERGNRLCSWKGDAKAFLAEGHRSSPRYEMTDSELERGALHFASLNCLVCGKQGN